MNLARDMYFHRNALSRVIALHRKKDRVTPAMTAGVSDKMWSLKELVEHTSR